MSETNGTVAVSSINTYKCFIVRSGNTIKIISPAREKTCELNTTLINVSTEINDDDKAMVERFVDGLVDGIEDRIDLTREEMTKLVEIRDKTNKYAVKETVEPLNGKVTDHVQATIALVHNRTVNGEVVKAANILNNTERKIIALQKTSKIYDEDFFQVEYDIPTRIQKLPKSKGGVDNPSSWFWNHAMRLSLSCWCFPQSSFNHQEVREWMDDAREKGCKVRVIKYAKDQIAIIKEMAAEELRVTMIEYHTSLITNIINADKRLNEALDKINEQVVEGTTSELSASGEARALEDYRNNQVRNHLRNAAERLKVGITAAETFDLTENVRDLFDAFHATLQAEAETFNAMALQRGVMRVNVKVKLPATPAIES